MHAGPKAKAIQVLLVRERLQTRSPLAEKASKTFGCTRVSRPEEGSKAPGRLESFIQGSQVQNTAS